MTWPHKVVYTSAGKPASCQDLSIPQFVHGYMIAMEGKEMSIKERMAAYLKDLMLDTEFYDWEHTKAFHSVWLNQSEQGRCTW